MTLDLLCSEYGWTKDYVLGCVTPAQVEVLARAIGRRRRMEAARELGLIRVAIWGDERQFAELRREVADDEAYDATPALAAMGIAVRSRRRGPGDDDGQPAS